MVSRSITPFDTAEGELEGIVWRIREVSAIMPQLVMEIIRITNDPQSSAAQLQGAVERDPSLAARLMRTANSPAYGLRRHLNTVREAICYLGFNEVKNLVVTTSLAGVFKADAVVGCYSRRGLWRHLVSVAAASRFVASRCGIRRFEEAYIAGLLHDFGLILMDQFLHQAFNDIVRVVASGKPLCESERKRLGFDHTQLGERVAGQWNLPAPTTAALRYHHRSDACQSDHRWIAHTVEVADFLCSAKRRSAVGIQRVDPPSGSAFAALSINRQGYAVLWNDLDGELAKADALMAIE
jgi:HD-like signal output (HDOD) protein